MQMVPATLMPESEEELKSLLMKVKEESEKLGLSLQQGCVVLLWWLPSAALSSRSLFGQDRFVS